MGSRVAKTLLAKGFFPKELPPVFSSELFADKIGKLRKLNYGEAGKKLAWTSCDSFSFPHSKVGRRTASLPNPKPFFALAELISRHWKEISSIYDQARFSFSRPKFNSKTRAVSSSNFDGYRESLVTRAAGYTYVLHADFSRYFPTIYTHAIEWAVHGKARSKANLKKRGAAKEYLWASDFDGAIQAMQDGQTQGVPIGPDTSYVVAEIMGAAIDKEFLRLHGRPVVGSRLIDDYALFFESRSAAEDAHASLVRAAAEYQIALNDEKTFVEPIGGSSKEGWVHQLREFRGATIQEQRREILRFTDLAISIVENKGVPSAARYAATVLARQTIHQRNVDLLLACMLRLVVHSADVLPVLVESIIGYHKVGYKIDKRPIVTYLGSALPRLIELGHDKESIWLIWLGICLNIKFKVAVVKAIEACSNSYILLLARFAEERGLCKGVAQSVLGAALVPDDFKSSNWLLAYEGATRGWFGWSRADVDGSILEPLAIEAISFLDFTALERSRITIKAGAPVVLGGVKPGGGGGASESWDDVDFDDLDELLDIEMDPDSYGYISDEEDEEEEEEEEEEDDDGEGVDWDALGY